MANVDAAFRVIDPRSKKSIFHIWRIEVNVLLIGFILSLNLICKISCVEKLKQRRGIL
jgi:hypothetical protein